MGRYHHYRAEHRKAIEFLERARVLAEPLDDPATLTTIYMYLAGAHQHLLLYEDSDRWAQATIALGERTLFPSAIAAGNEFLSENAVGRGLWDASLVYAAKDREQGARIGSLAREAWSEFCHAQGLYGKGQLVAARDTTLAALSMCEQIGEDRLATWLEPLVATISADLGDDAAARMHAERGWQRAKQMGQLMLSAWALNALGYAARLRGANDEAVQWYEQYVALVRDTENGVARNVVMACAAQAFLHAARVDDAARLVEQAVTVTQFAKSRHYLALARRVQGQVHVVRQEYDDALRAFDDAIATLTSIGSGLELARAMYHRAALRLTRGDAKEDEAARAEAARARDSFAAMGAVHDRALAEQLLRE
jgi:tetratricopeptide (TPR) repeat protein